MLGGESLSLTSPNFKDICGMDFPQPNILPLSSLHNKYIHIYFINKELLGLLELFLGRIPRLVDVRIFSGPATFLVQGLPEFPDPHLAGFLWLGFEPTYLAFCIGEHHFFTIVEGPPEWTDVEDSKRTSSGLEQRLCPWGGPAGREEGLETFHI